MGSPSASPRSLTEGLSSGVMDLVAVPGTWAGRFVQVQAGAAGLPGELE